MIRSDHLDFVSIAAFAGEADMICWKIEVTVCFLVLVEPRVEEVTVDLRAMRLLRLLFFVVPLPFAMVAMGQLGGEEKGKAQNRGPSKTCAHGPLG